MQLFFKLGLYIIARLGSFIAIFIELVKLRLESYTNLRLKAILTLFNKKGIELVDYLKALIL